MGMKLIRHDQPEGDNNKKEKEVLKQELVDESAEILEALKESAPENASMRDRLTFIMLSDNPLMQNFPVLTSLLCDILLFRLTQRKNKLGFLTATVNQITVGINVTEELLDGTEFDNNSKE